MEKRLEWIVVAFFVLVFGIALISSWSYPFQDGVGIWFCASFGITLASVTLYRTLRKTTQSELAASEFDSQKMETAAGKYWGRMGILLLFILGLIIMTYLIGLPFSSLLMILIYGRWQAKLRWLFVIISILVDIAFLAYFAYVIGVFWPEPLISRWIALPRMLGGVR